MGVPNAMNRAFTRLRWSVFDPPSITLVVDSPAAPNSPLVHSIGHPIAVLPATDVPLREIPFYINPPTEWEHPDHQYPEKLIVRWEDGGVVSVGDVVEQLSESILLGIEGISLRLRIFRYPGLRRSGRMGRRCVDCRMRMRIRIRGRAKLILW